MQSQSSQKGQQGGGGGGFETEWRRINVREAAFDDPLRPPRCPLIPGERI